MSDIQIADLCCLLWSREGHAGSDEVQNHRFPSQSSLDSHLADPRRLALAAERHRVVGRTKLFPVAHLR